MSERERRKQRRRQQRREKRRGDEGPVETCFEAVADSCSGCRTCCPEMWLASIFLALVRPVSRPPGRPGTGADPAAPRPGGRAAGVMYDAVRHYRVTVSPTRPACCPYTPSCSTYAVKALERHGALRGGRLILGRLLRCRPGAARRRGFSDPVPR
ncbi:membrane protein insertion efficiency factor YidD [Streptomyces goshikiensis]|uniref:membrane protein insertion efficiency factor YidD n=1 Tax=Streptomyces goshikiensis TaxID=1942 RepID=UPI003649CF4A